MLRVSRTIGAPAPRVWEVIADPARWPAWGPSLRDAQSTDRTLRRGSRGRVKTQAGFWLPFHVVEFSEGRYWRWRVAGIAATGHRVEPLGDACSRLTFEVPVWAAPYAIVCALAARRIATLCEKQKP